jgi:hypothetical protein
MGHNSVTPTRKKTSGWHESQRYMEEVKRELRAELRTAVLLLEKPEGGGW